MVEQPKAPVAAGGADRPAGSAGAGRERSLPGPSGAVESPATRFQGPPPASAGLPEAQPAADPPRLETVESGTGHLEQLRNSLAYARNLLEASLDPLVTISPEGRITDVNQATEVITGVGRERLIGSSFSQYFTQPEEADRGYQRVLAEGLVRDYPLTIRHVSGRTADVLYHATVYRNETGRVLGVFAAARDITERKEADRQRETTAALLGLFASKRTRQDYLEAVVALVAQWSGCQGVGIRVVEENRAAPFVASVGLDEEFLRAESHFALERETCCCGRAIRQTREEQDRELLTAHGSFFSNDARSFFKGLPPGLRARYRGGCLRRGFVSLAVIPIRRGADVLGVVHLADLRPDQVPLAKVQFIESIAPLIGEAIQRFRAEETLAAQSQQLRTLAVELTHAEERERRRLAQAVHDHLQQLLAGGKLCAETLQRRLRASPLRELTGQVVEYFSQAIESARTLTFELSPPILYDGGLGPALVWLGRWMASKHGLTVAVSVSPDSEPRSEEVRVLLFQAARELLFNVVKHAGVKNARARLSRPEGGPVRLEIRDRGVGFDPERLRSAEVAASGFGLFSIRGRLELLGGRLEIVSTPGRGSCFTLLVPADQLPAQTVAPSRADRPNRSRCRGPSVRRAGAGRPRTGGEFACCWRTITS